MKNLQLILATLLLCVVIFSCSSDDSASNPETGSDTFTNTLTINGRMFSSDSLLFSKHTVSRETSLSFTIVNSNPNDISNQEKIFIWVEHHKDSLTTGTYKIDPSYGDKELDRFIVRNTSYETGTLNVIGQTKDYTIDDSNSNNIIKIIEHGDKVYTIEIDAYFEYYHNPNSEVDPNQEEIIHIKGVFKNKFKDFRDILGL